MQPSPYHFLPFPALLYVGFVAVLVIVFALIEFGVVHYTAARLGIEPRRLFVLLLLCLLGSYINIPVAQLPPEPVESGRVVYFYGTPLVIPVVRKWPGPIVAVNVGGALIPTGLAIYLLVKNRLYLQGPIAAAVVALAVHLLARPVRGVGISVPMFLPPIIAVLVAMALSWKLRAPLAYAAGTLGTLIGADLMNLGALAGLGAPITSIGGAGTFDGVFLTGVVAVLLA
jgi:uncharacterized membrane protein